MDRNRPWKDALTDPGAIHVSVAARLLKSMAWWQLVPDQSVFARGAGSNVAARSGDGNCVIMYLANAAKVSARMPKLSTGPVRATWVDPKTGARTPTGEYPNTGVRSFSPPDGWNDAVLLLETAGRTNRIGS